jgi:putative flavoprotein involved in K+ transport
MEHVETLVVGGGQAGLTMSHMLQQRGLPHLVLERHRIAERWRTERWHGLRFQFPNWSVSLPDFPFPHTDPDAFATSAEILDYILAYADFVSPPIRCGVAVTALRNNGPASRFVAETSEGPIEASNVVVASGPYQRPVVPKLLPADVDILQVHASRYTAPNQLPPGAVLVVGSGASGAQISEELCRAGRRVYLSTGRHRRMPRRYRGHDMVWWLSTLGLDQTPVERRGPDRALPLITGAYGGHTIDFREFAEWGITLLGRVEAVHGDVLQMSPDLRENLAHGDRAFLAFLDLVDAHVQRHRLPFHQEPEARTIRPDPPCVARPFSQLDLQRAGISSVIWATGYGVDFNWIRVGALDAFGEPIHRRGIADVPGIYFLGLQWLSKMNSSFLAGVGDDAARLADHIATRC